MNLTQEDLADAIRHHLGFNRMKSDHVVKSLLETIKKTLEHGEDVLITGFGKFCVKHKRKRRGRNPQTREDLMLAARRVVTSKWSGVLKDKINGER